jgi:hypothetical protein
MAVFCNRIDQLSILPRSSFKWMRTFAEFPTIIFTPGLPLAEN